MGGRLRVVNAPLETVFDGSLIRFAALPARIGDGAARYRRRIAEIAAKAKQNIVRDRRRQRRVCTGAKVANHQLGAELGQPFSRAHFVLRECFTVRRQPVRQVARVDAYSQNRGPAVTGSARRESRITSAASQPSTLSVGATMIARNQARE